MNPKCHICDIESKFLLNKDDFDLYECSSCKLVFVHPQPTPQFLKEEVYSEQSGYQSNRAEDLSKIVETTRAKKVLDFFEKKNPNGKILDVGCSGGHFMYWAQKRGLESCGVELNKKTADSARSYGFEVYNGFLGEATFQKNSFDFIFLGEIIEHVNSPRELIKQCSDFLKLGGFIAITTPNIDCFWSKSTFILYKLFRIPWSSVTPPYHLFQFSPINLDLLLEQNKFELAHSSFILMTRLKYELGMLHLLKRFKKSKKITDFIFMTFAYIVYTVTYIINIITAPFRYKDFNMIRIYRKL